MKKSFRLSLACLSLTLAFGADLYAAERQSTFAVTAKQMQALGIDTMPLQQAADPVVQSLPAQVTVPANREQIVSAPLAGLAVEVLVEPNQVVKKNAALLRIASPELGPLQLQLMQAASRTSLARQSAQRERTLYDEGIVSQRRMQEAQAALFETEAALRQAKAALRLAGMSDGQIGQIAASGKLVDSVTLTAASAGTVTSVSIKPGQRIEPSVALMHLAQVDRLVLDIQAPAALAAAWPAGSKLTVQGRPGNARVTSVSPVVSAGSQTVSIRAQIDGNAGGLRPGEFVTVQMPLGAAAGTWDVPLAALAHERNQAYAFVRTATGFEARPVKVISSAAQRVRISGQFMAGEKIAVSGVVALKGSWLGEKGGD